MLSLSYWYTVCVDICMCVHVCVCVCARMTPVIDPEVLENMRMSQFVGHAPKPSHIRYNQVPYDLDRDTRDHVPESPMKRGG